MSWRSPNFDFRWSGRAIELATTQVLFRSTQQYTTQLYILRYLTIHTKFSKYCSTGGVDTKGYLRRRITAILSIFNFSTLFLAQIQDNRWGRRSGPFLGPGDNFFEKLWRKPDPVWAPPRVYTLIWRWDFAAKDFTSSIVWQICFRHNFSKNYPQDLKMVEKDASRDSLQSALKIRC